LQPLYLLNNHYRYKILQIIRYLDRFFAQVAHLGPAAGAGQLVAALILDERLLALVALSKHM
jgi:hypothetical protein